MKLVVDANILFSFFRDNPVRFMIINSSLLDLQLFSPAYALEELYKNIKDLIRYTKLSSIKIKSIIGELKGFISVISSSEYKQFESEAGRLSPHNSDKDTPYFALALKLKCPIWSNEPAFKKQSKIKILSTQELRDILSVE